MGVLLWFVILVREAAVREESRLLWLSGGRKKIDAVLF
jgi:hypothetical protein